MTRLGGGFQSFSIRVPLLQICTRLDLLTNKRVARPPAERKPSRTAKSGLGRKGSSGTVVSVALVGEGGQFAGRVQLPPGAPPDVIVWEDRFFLRSSVDGGYRESHGYHAPGTKATLGSKRNHGKERT